MRKPPLGITPRHVWEEQRHEELQQTILRHINTGHTIQPQWIEEYNELTLKRQKRLNGE